jgi:hypothetical protein
MISYVMVPVFLLVMSGSSLPVDNKNTQTNDVLEGKRVCSVLKESVDKGEDIKKVVKTGIEMGYNACYVVKCAISGGGDLKQIIAGAVEAGATPDVVARCAVDAGAEATDVVRCLVQAGTTSICYFQPVAGLGYSSPVDELVPMDPAPRSTAAGRFISPSSF